MHNNHRSIDITAAPSGELYFPDQSQQPCTLVLFWAAVETDKGSRSFTLSIHVRDGAFEAIIDSLTKLGGIWVKDHEDASWFLPWPPRLIRLDRAP